MKIAFTGSSSTGKTTLAMSLKEDARFRVLLQNFITIDARSLLKEYGFRGLDNMSTQDRIRFQRLYLERKLLLENGEDGYLTDRSFIDVAAYWLEVDAASTEASDVGSYVECCRKAANRYDIHFYFPFGLFQFEADGYRSEQACFNERIDSRISQLIREWGIEVVNLDMKDLTARCDAVVDWFHTK